MKIYFPVGIFTLLLCVACESSIVTRGRKAYEKYFQETMLDPRSYILYDETIIDQTDVEVTFVLDVGGKNSYGGMIRKTYTIKTIGDNVFDIKEYDVRIMNNTSSPKNETPNKSIPIKYKELKLPPSTNIQNYDGKTVKLVRDVIGAYNANKLGEAIDAVKSNDCNHYNHLEREYDIEIIPKDAKIKIDSSASVVAIPSHKVIDCFFVKYDNRKFVVEQAQVLCK